MHGLVERMIRTQTKQQQFVSVRRDISPLRPSGDPEHQPDGGRHLGSGQHDLHPGRLLHPVLQLLHPGRPEPLLRPQRGPGRRRGGPAGQRSNSARVRPRPPPLVSCRAAVWGP